MKRLLKKFEDAMTAVAFAEAAEFETAREIMNEDKPKMSNRVSIRKKQRPTKRKELRVD